MPIPRKTPARRGQPVKGSLRVQAWLHGVLWPLHEALHRAVAHLEAGDPTWRHGPRRLEGLRDPAAYLSHAGRANLDDLLAARGERLRPAIDRYAAALAHLGVAAAGAHDALVGSVRAAAGRVRGGAADGETIETVVEDLVNGTIDREIAGPAGRLVEALAAELPALRAARPGGLDAALADAAAAGRDLLAEVDALRRELCDRYDLPPAPVTIPVHNH